MRRMVKAARIEKKTYMESETVIPKKVIVKKDTAQVGNGGEKRTEPASDNFPSTYKKILVNQPVIFNTSEENINPQTIININKNLFTLRLLKDNRNDSQGALKILNEIINEPTFISLKDILFKSRDYSLSLVDQLLLLTCQLSEQIADKTAIQKILTTLLHNGANVNVQENDGCTPIFNLVMAGDVQNLDFLLENFAAQIAFEITYKEENTVLHEACANGDPKIVRLLLSCGAKKIIDVQNEKGNTALMLAADYGLEPVVELLVSEGANQLLKNKDGHDYKYLLKQQVQVDEDKSDEEIIQDLQNTGLASNATQNKI